ncbi:MAG TPA: hypothetical protein VKA36_08430 [Solirubrobacterales bacterium]|nr:hypothetical protein [Solirubrobacterales bacterium]
MSSRKILGAIAVGRLLIGIAMLIVPREVARRWLGRGAATPESGSFVRAVGGRDVAYSLGSLQAARSGDPRPWLAAGLLVDGVDSWATMTTEGLSTGRKLSGGWAAFVAVGMAVAGLLAEDEQPPS